MDFIDCHMQTAFVGKRFRFPAKAEEFLRKGLTLTKRAEEEHRIFF